MLHKPDNFFRVSRHFPLFLYDSVNYIWWQTIKNIYIFQAEICDLVVRTKSNPSSLPFSHTIITKLQIMYLYCF